MVGDVRSGKIGQPNEMEFYRPWTQENFPFMSHHRAQPDEDRGSDSTGPAGIDSESIRPWPWLSRNRWMRWSTAALGEARLMMCCSAFSPASRLLLATVGIYGAVAYTVEQRTGEIGVRMALGAQTLDVLRLVVSQGMKPVLFGLIIGLAAALALGRLIASQLYQVSAHNPMLLGTTVAILGAAALLACIFPARRASRVNPVVALRAE